MFRLISDADPFLSTNYGYLLFSTYIFSFFCYSGDMDGRVPVIGSRYWVEALGLPVKSQWQPWSGLFDSLIIRLFRLVFSAGTVFFSHNKSEEQCFGLFFQ